MALTCTSLQDVYGFKFGPLAQLQFCMLMLIIVCLDPLKAASLEQRHKQTGTVLCCFGKLRLILFLLGLFWQLWDSIY